MRSGVGKEGAQDKPPSGVRWIWTLVGVLGSILLFLGFIVRTERHSDEPSRGTEPRTTSKDRSADSAAEPASGKGPSEDSATLPKSGPRLWPRKEVVIGPPADAPGAAKEGGPKEKTATTDDGARSPHAPSNAPSAMKLATSPKPSQDGSRAGSNKVGKRPPPPSAQKVQEVAGWKVGEEGTLEKARALLLDADQSSTLKLLAIEKVRKFPADRAVPILLEFLESSRPPDDAYTAPTAVRALVDLRHPLGDEALAKLAKSPRDERVRLAIASLWGEGRGK